MKKVLLQKIFLVLLPSFAVGMACDPNAVLIFNTAEGTYSASSFFALLPKGNFQISTVLAGLLACLAGGLAIVYCISKKPVLLKDIFYVALAAAGLAAIPVVLNSEIRVLPNVGVPILLLVQAMIAFLMNKALKGQVEQPEKKGKRLSKR